MDWDDNNQKYVGDSIGIEKLYGLCDSYDDLEESKHRWQENKTNEELLAELQEDIYKATIEFYNKKFA